MMRYQRVSPDCLPLSNGRKPGARTVKEDDHPENDRVLNRCYDGKGPRVRSAAALNPSTSQDHHFPQFVLPSPDLSAHHHHENHPPAKALNHHDVSGNSPSRGGGDVLLQWGHKKRSRGSRAESRAVGDEASSALATQAAKIQRRSSVPGVEKQAAAAMPPPGPGYSRGANLRPCSSARDPVASAMNRSGEERSGSSVGRSEKRSTPPSSLDKAPHKTAASACTAVAGNGLLLLPPADAENNMASTPSSDAGDAPAAKEKLNLDLFEWPRIYISLSRKEKEDDFLAMKGSKLPQRPKKRAKNVDKTLQYVFPGMWLSDLTRGRYEVREKKSVKKKRRGLKGMESIDSESEE